MSEKNKTFCVMPWLHLHAWPAGDAYLCCIAGTGEKKNEVGDLSTQSIAEIINGDKMKEIRKKMLAGEKVSNCQNCYNAEAVKGYSWREGFNHQFKHHIDDIKNNTAEDGSIDPQLRYIDFRFSNLCNLECRTCGGELSSSIANRTKRNFPDSRVTQLDEKGVLSKGNIVAYSNKNKYFTEDLKNYLQDTECFYFAGGEPLMQKEHYDVLKYVHDNKWFDKELRYSTNLSNLHYKQTDFVEMWKDFDEVWLMCSIDHYGDKLEHIRQNVKSDRLWANFDRLVDTHFRLSITSVISIYNIYYLYDFFKFLDDKGYMDRLHTMEMLHVFGETETPAVLPNFAKEELIKKLKEDEQSDLYKKLFEKFPYLAQSITGLPDFVNGTSTYTWKEFVERVETFDRIYDKDTAKTFPWLGEVIEKSKTSD